MQKKTILAMTVGCFWGVVAVCVIGIIIGSFRDFEINVALANKTDIGAFFATYGSYFSYCLYPAAGACLFVGLKEKGDRFRALAWVLLLVVRQVYLNMLESFFPGMERPTMTMAFIVGVALLIIVSIINVVAVKSKITGIWRQKE